MGSRGVLCAHEANAGQRAGWSGEGQGTVQVAGPDRAAERSAGPQAAGVAKDRCGRVGRGAGTAWPGRAGIRCWGVPKVGRATAKLVPASLGGLIA